MCRILGCQDLWVLDGWKTSESIEWPCIGQGHHPYEDTVFLKGESFLKLFMKDGFSAFSADAGAPMCTYEELRVMLFLPSRLRPSDTAWGVVVNPS